jgi:hypothetical protein
MSLESQYTWSPEKKALALTVLLSTFFTIATTMLDDTFTSLTHLAGSSHNPIVSMVLKPLGWLSDGHEWLVGQNESKLGIHSRLLEVFLANAEISTILAVPLYFGKRNLIRKIRSDKAKKDAE